MSLRYGADSCRSRLVLPRKMPPISGNEEQTGARALTDLGHLVVSAGGADHGGRCHFGCCAPRVGVQQLLGVLQSQGDVHLVHGQSAVEVGLGSLGGGDAPVEATALLPLRHLVHHVADGHVQQTSINKQTLTHLTHVY